VKCTRFYTGDDGRSHFENLEIPLQLRRLGAGSEPVTATGISFWEYDGGAIDLHPAPRRQIVLCLAGELEIECGDGDKRRFGPGDVCLADDLSGEGHILREIAGPLRLAWVFLPPDMDLSAWRVPTGSA
jgi:hypothetical protein